MQAEVIAIYQPLTSLFISFVALIISLIALKYTISRHALKNGEKAQGYASFALGTESDEPYVHEVFIQNLKDKALIIHGIYVEVSASLTIVVEECEESDPIIVKPFEFYKKKYDPVDCYTFSSTPVDMSIALKGILFSKKTPKLVLNTFNGKVIVKQRKFKWHPLSAYFKNRYRKIFHPKRLYIKDVAFGKNCNYLVKISRKEQKDENILIYENTYQNMWFSNIGGSRKDLYSAETLSSLFNKAKENGLAKFDRVEVIDLQKEYKEINSPHHEVRKKPKVYNHSNIFVSTIGLAHTKIGDILMGIKNKRFRKRR